MCSVAPTIVEEAAAPDAGPADRERSKQPRLAAEGTVANSDMEVRPEAGLGAQQLPAASGHARQAASGAAAQQPLGAVDGTGQATPRPASLQTPDGLPARSAPGQAAEISGLLPSAEASTGNADSPQQPQADTQPENGTAGGGDTTQDSAAAEEPKQAAAEAELASDDGLAAAKGEIQLDEELPGFRRRYSS